LAPGGKQTTLAFHLTKMVNKAKELSYLSTNIDFRLSPISYRTVMPKVGKARREGELSFLRFDVKTSTM
jgi:hypothetical protein